MRPESIVSFERLFLLSIAISVVDFVLAFARTGARQFEGLGPGAVTALFVASIVIYLLLWFLIARQASNIAKWFLVVIFVLSLTGLPGLFAGPFDLSAILGLVSLVLQLAAIIFLFRADAVAWLKGTASEA